MVSNHTLVKIAAIGGAITITMGLGYRYKLNERIAKTVYYKEALKTVRENKGAVYILGEPIKDGTIDVGDTIKNYTNDLSAKYEVPVRGTKEKGILYFWACRKNNEEMWVVNRIELGLKKEPNKRLLIKNVEL